MLILGEQEAASGRLSVRKQGEGDLGSFTVDEFTAIIKDAINSDLN
jgi:threonyl-tRNA synthetase